MIKWIVIMTFTTMIDSGDVKTRDIGLANLYPTKEVCESIMEIGIPNWMEYYRKTNGTGNVEFRCMEVMFGGEDGRTRKEDKST